MAREWYGVAGRAVLVTGAARGIGAEAARQLAGRGARLSLVGLEPEELERRASELGGGHVWFEADVSSAEALEAAVEATVERLGGIDVVIANAGVAPNGPVATMDPAAFDRTIEVNLTGVWRTVRAALPAVVARRGYILPIASLAVVVQMPLMAAYSASKAGVEAFANSLRLELAHTGTSVGVGYFGFIDTDMVRCGFGRDSAQLLRDRLGGGPLGAIAGVEAAGRAIVRGVERRARHVVAPRWVLPMLYARTLLQPLTEARLRRIGVEDAVRAAEREPTELSTPQEPVAG